jgi:hypothetical protein
MNLISHKGAKMSKGDIKFTFFPDIKKSVEQIKQSMPEIQKAMDSMNIKFKIKGDFSLDDIKNFKPNIKKIQEVFKLDKLSTQIRNNLKNDFKTLENISNNQINSFGKHMKNVLKDVNKFYVLPDSLIGKEMKTSGDEKFANHVNFIIEQLDKLKQAKKNGEDIKFTSAFLTDEKEILIDDKLKPSLMTGV